MKFIAFKKGGGFNIGIENYKYFAGLKLFEYMVFLFIKAIFIVAVIGAFAQDKLFNQSHKSL